MRVTLRAAALCLFAACGSDPPPPLGAITAMTFNVASDTVRDPIAGPNMAGQVARANPDFAALQECIDCAGFVARLPPQYALATLDVPDAVAYDTTRWVVVEDGLIILGTNDDGWGRRDAAYARFRDLATGGVVDVYSTHWCVTIRAPNDACDVARHGEYAAALLDSVAARGAAAILGGDFNVFDGFESSRAVQQLLDGGLTDALRAVSADPTPTFIGNSWAPPGRIDYLFATSPVAVSAARIDTSVPLGAGSDHRPVIATLSFDRDL